MSIWNIEVDDDDYDGDWSDKNEKMSINEVEEIEVEEVDFSDDGDDEKIKTSADFDDWND